MGKYKLIETREKDGQKITYVWHPRTMPEGIPVQQVYGFVSTEDKLIALVREKGGNSFTPPGGGVEDGESAFQALNREFMEELQCIPEQVKLLGSLEVINDSATDLIQKHNLQVRFVCKIGKLDTFIPLKDNETEERIFVYYKDLPKYVGFIEKYITGKVQYEMYCDYLEKKISL